MKLPRPSTQVALVCCCTVLAGCAKSDSGAAADSTSAVVPAPSGSTSTTTSASSGAVASATPISFADIAGRWQMRSVPESGSDTSATQYTLIATRDSSGWKIAYKNGPTIAVHVSTSGDSVVADAGPHKSMRRKGVDVATHSVYRKEGDKLVGRTIAHYTTKGADSVLTLRAEGTRAP